MKKVYLVRHGESETNAGNIMFGKSAKLTARGHEQAKFIAGRCARLPIEVIISSGFPRADDTARYIVDAVGKPLEQSDLFAERRHPSFPLGRSKSEPDYVAFEEGFWNRFDDPSWRHQDAENFADLNARSSVSSTSCQPPREEHSRCGTRLVYKGFGCESHFQRQLNRLRVH